MRQLFSFVVLGSLHDASYLLVLLYLEYKSNIILRSICGCLFSSAIRTLCINKTNPSLNERKVAPSFDFTLFGGFPGSEHGGVEGRLLRDGVVKEHKWGAVGAGAGAHCERGAQRAWSLATQPARRSCPLETRPSRRLEEPSQRPGPLRGHFPV